MFCWLFEGCNCSNNRGYWCFENFIKKFFFFAWLFSPDNQPLAVCATFCPFFLHHTVWAMLLNWDHEHGVIAQDSNSYFQRKSPKKEISSDLWFFKEDNLERKDRYLLYIAWYTMSFYLETSSEWKVQSMCNNQLIDSRRSMFEWECYEQHLPCLVFFLLVFNEVWDWQVELQALCYCSWVS